MSTSVLIADQEYEGDWSAGGLVKNDEQLKKVAYRRDGTRSKAGVIVIGSVLEIEVEGNRGVTYHSDVKVNPRGKVNSSNSVGLTSGGWEKEYQFTLGPMIDFLHGLGTKAVVNVVGFTPEQVASLVKKVYALGADLVIINLSCGNTGGDVLFFEDSFVFPMVARVRKVVPHGKQVLFKVPYIPSRSMLRRRVEFFDCFEWVGGIIAINTVANTLTLNPLTGKPYIEPFKGLAGLGGAGIRPLALGQCQMLLEEINDLQSDMVVGACGGIQTPEDKEMFMEGENVQVHFVKLHTAVREFGSEVFDDLAD